MTKTTLELFRQLLGQVSLNPLEPEFEDKAKKCAIAIKEIEAELNGPVSDTQEV